MDNYRRNDGLLTVQGLKAGLKDVCRDASGHAISRERENNYYVITINHEDRGELKRVNMPILKESALVFKHLKERVVNKQFTDGEIVHELRCALIGRNNDARWN